MYTVTCVELLCCTEEDTEYELRVLAINRDGSFNPSEVLTVSTAVATERKGVNSMLVYLFMLE